MKKGSKALLAAGGAVLVGVVAFLSLRGTNGSKGKEVYLAQAVRRDLASTVSANGVIEAKTRVNIQSSVIGEIVELPVKEGDRVRSGQLLVQIDPERYRSEVRQLEATLRMQRIAVERQQVALENLRRNLQRQEQLFAEGLVAPEALERSQLDFRQAEIQLRALEEQVAQAEASLAKARDDLKKTRIVSPIDGVVTLVNAEKGEIALTGTMNNPGTVILVVSDLSEILAEVNVDENRIVQVRPGQAATVVVDAVGETSPYRGRVLEIAGSAVQDRGSEVRLFPVKIALDNPDETLRPGMTARARIETARVENALVVPIQAVLLRPKDQVEKILAARAEGEKKQGARGSGLDTGGPAALAAEGSSPPPTPAGKTRDGQPRAAAAAGEKREVVFKVVAGKAVLTPVRTGISDETGVVVLEGLAEGDTIVTGPYRAVRTLKDGDSVREKKEESEPGGGGEASQEGIEVRVD